MEFGLSDRIVKDLREAIAAQPHIERVDIYGSRARGNYHEASDIDLAVYGDEDFTFKDYLHLIGRFDDLPIIFKIDVVDMGSIDKLDLQKSIKNEAVQFWKA